MENIYGYSKRKKINKSKLPKLELHNEHLAGLRHTQDGQTPPTSLYSTIPSFCAPKSVHSIDEEVETQRDDVLRHFSVLIDTHCPFPVSSTTKGTLSKKQWLSGHPCHGHHTCLPARPLKTDCIIRWLPPR